MCFGGNQFLKQVCVLLTSYQKFNLDLARTEASVAWPLRCCHWRPLVFNQLICLNFVFLHWSFHCTRHIAVISSQFLIVVVIWPVSYRAKFWPSFCNFEAGICLLWLAAQALRFKFAYRWSTTLVWAWGIGGLLARLFHRLSRGGAHHLNSWKDHIKSYFWLRTSPDLTSELVALLAAQRFCSYQEACTPAEVSQLYGWLAGLL